MVTSRPVSEPEAAVLAIVGIFLLFFIVIALILWVLNVIGQWKVFKKAGKPGWAAIIPIYNMWVLYEISDIKPIYVLLTAAGAFLAGVGNTLSTIGTSTDSTVVVILSIIVNLISLPLSIGGLVFSIMACMNLAKKFKKSSLFGLGLAFLSFIFFPILGFSKTATYDKDAK